MNLISLKTELRQELKLTPQLLQSMEVLQMNSQELLDYLGKLSEENPTLELSEASELRSAYAELRQKASWLDAGTFGTSFAHEEDGPPEPGATDKELDSLSAFLCDQLERKRLPKPMLALCKYMAELVDEDGYLTQEDLDGLTEMKIPQTMVDQALDTIQSLEPAGVGARDLTVSITENFDGVSIDHLKTLPASVKFITEDGHGVQDNATMAKAFAICTQKDITVMSHAEDMEISPWDYRLAEDIETVRNCWLSEYYQTRLHMCHVSTRGALDAIQMAKLRGAPVTCEVTPHHLWFTNDTCDYRVNPPIRTADDVQALVDGIRTGIVDAIATDHAPHSEEDKLKGMAGMVGSETAFGVCYTKLCKQEGLPLEVLVHLMSTRPAEILGLAKGQLEPGYDADFVLVDLDTPYTVDKDKLHSKSHNTPFDGAELYGKVCATIKGGKLTYQAED